MEIETETETDRQAEKTEKKAEYEFIRRKKNEETSERDREG